MAEIIELRLADGDTVLVEVDDPTGISRAGAHDAAGRAKESFEAAFSHVRSAASAAVHAFTTMPRRPDEVELKFGVKLDAQARAIIAKSGVQAQFEVKMRWADRSGPGQAPETSADPEEADPSEEPTSGASPVPDQGGSDT